MNPKYKLAKISEPGFVLTLTAILGSILYISLVFNDNLWMDEAFTAALIRGSFPDVIRDTVSDTLPPFYNVIGKLITLVFGYSSTVLKLFSCLPMVMLIYFGGRKMYSVFNFRTALLYEIFLFSMPCFLHYGIEIRMYSWGIFCCGMAGAYLCGLLKDRTSWTGFILFTVFSGYVHHFAFVSCGMLWFVLLIFLLVKKDMDTIKKYFRSLLMVFILYFPCMILSAYQIKNAGSYFEMAPLTFSSFLADLRYPFVTNVTPLSALLLTAAAAVLLFSLYLAIVNKEIRFLCITALMTVSAFFLTLIFGYAVSLVFGRSIFTARYLSPALALFWMGISILTDIAITMAGNRFILIFLTTLLTVSTAYVCYSQAFRDEYRPGVDNMKAFFRENTGSDDALIILENGQDLRICFNYYFPDLNIVSWKSSGETKGKLWLIDGENTEKELDKADKYGYNPKYISDFGFDRYSFSLYELSRE